MTQPDDRLQEALEELERGIPLETVLKNLPPGSLELAPLIQLASQASMIKHPEMSPEKAQQLQQKLDAASSSHLRPGRPAAHQPLWRGLSPAVQAWQRQPKLFTGLAIGLVAVLAVIGLWVYSTGPASAHAATLTNLNGMVEVTDRQDASSWHFVLANETVQQGQSIRTYYGSSVTLVYFDGSQSAIGQDSELTLTHLDGTWNRSLQVELSQKAGITNNNVIPFRSSASFFHVDTPQGQAVVHGTIFGVDVKPETNSIFSVERGRVQVTAGSSQVYLTAGQATLVLPNGIAETPAFEFRLMGKLTAVSGQQWTVGGVNFMVNDQAAINGNPQIGDSISVRGRILESGQWTADRIEPIGSDVEKARFAGLVVSMGADTWVVSKQTLTVNADTEIEPGLQVGDPVEVTFEVQPDGTWLAKEIQAQLEGTQPPPTPTATLTETVTTTGTISPSETATATLTETATPTQTLTPETTGTVTPTATVTVTPTPEGSITPTGTSTAVSCTGGPNKQPQGLVLAARYKVTYEEIMGWFCQHFGFGEIDLAYSLSQQTGVPVTQIFAMRQSGLGWGQIKQQLDTKPGNGKKKP